MNAQLAPYLSIPSNCTMLSNRSILDPPPADALPVRPLLQGGEDQPGALRLLRRREARGRAAGGEVEEAGLREPLLPALHPSARHQLWHQLHLPRAEEQA